MTTCEQKSQQEDHEPAWYIRFIESDDKAFQNRQLRETAFLVLKFQKIGQEMDCRDSATGTHAKKKKLRPSISSHEQISCCEFDSFGIEK